MWCGEIIGLEVRTYLACVFQGHMCIALLAGHILLPSGSVFTSKHYLECISPDKYCALIFFHYGLEKNRHNTWMPLGSSTNLDKLPEL